MKERTEQIRKDFENDYAGVSNDAELEALRLKYLGKKGVITDLMSTFREIPNEEKREAGRLVNDLKSFIESQIVFKKESLEKEAVEKQVNSSEKVDITLPVDIGVGSLHPRTILQRKIEQVFVSMGFTVEDGDEIVTEFENFDAVNVPASHPARDMQDTFWLSNNQVLKTHTSALQNRTLRKYNGPVKAIFPGRCYRNEAVDNSHETTFFQIEGMLVDKNVSVANLIFFMKEMLTKVFEKEVDVRLRPGFFPFVEPGFELDMKCPFCGGKGCKTCKNSGWIETCPCGMIHPRVLELGGLDPNAYSGFAFGLGFDRLVMMRTGLDDIRHLNSGNLKVLKQFKLDV